MLISGVAAMLLCAQMVLVIQCNHDDLGVLVTQIE